MQTLKGKFNFRHVLIIGTTVTILLVQILALLPNVTTPFEKMEYGARDMLMRLRGKQPASSDIVIVGVDDFSLSWTNLRWPFPRSYLAEVVNQIHAGGGKIVGVDLFLFAPDAEEGNDEKFAEALGKVPYAVNVLQVVKNPDNEYNLVTVNAPTPKYEKALDATGITAFIRDEDAILRSISAYEIGNDTIYYHWAFEVARLYLGVDEPKNPTSASVEFNGQKVPLHAGQLLVNYAGGAGTYTTYSAANVHDGVTLEETPNAFKDKIVLIGVTTVSVQDVYPTPFSTQIPTPGVEVVAAAIDTIIHGKYLYEAPPWVSLVLIIVAAIAASLISKSNRPIVTVEILGASIIAYLIAATLLFIFKQYILPIILPLTMLFLGVVLPTLEQAVSQELEKRRVRSLFSRFISPEMVDQMMGTQDINSLNKRADLTILFSDIRGFTTLSEKLTPEGVVKLLNPYLAAMTDVIHKHGGTVDKYEGDAIVAFFGEPIHYKDHAIRTVSAAVDMLKVLEELSAQWIRDGLAEKGFNIGIGVNTGDVFVGLLGSAQRVNYTIIGDNANLAARLQDQTKTYAWPILISESTYQQVKEIFDTEFADAVTVKGKSKPVNVYKVLGRKDAPESEKVQPWH